MSKLGPAAIGTAMLMYLWIPSIHAQQHSLTQLTFSDSTHDGYPYWSPDGKSIIYSSGTTTTCRTMKIPAGGGRPELVTPVFAQHARWSPEGTYIAFDGDFGSKVMVVPAAGGQPVRIDPDTLPVLNSGMPCWSPDGGRLAFKSMFKICILDLETGKVTEFFSPEGKNAIAFDWSPDGQMILMDVRDTADRSQSDIWRVPLEGEPEQLTFLPGRQVKPSISPDGSMILFTSDHGGNADLWVMPAGGGEPVQLTFFEGDESNPGYDIEASWSPDGKSVAFSSTRKDIWAIWRMDLDMDFLRTQLFGRISYSVAYPLAEPAGFPDFPNLLEKNPGLPSPFITGEGREMVLVKDREGRYIWFDATVENGSTLDYKQSLQGKGNQLRVNGFDFPHLATTGLHSDQELAQTKSITGRSVSLVTVDGRPGCSSGTGFMAQDETVMSVLWSDNRMVRDLGLTHHDLARPLMQLWNISNEREKYNEKAETGKAITHKALIYNDNEIEVKISGSRGWQESIFNDEILGSYHMEMWRRLKPEEESFLLEHYGHLPDGTLQDLVAKLTHIHTGEMVPYYINRYGFYEGHTDFRAEPLSIAFIFGLRSIGEIHRVCGGDLYSYLNTHFTRNP